MNGKSCLAVLAFCVTCLSACATGEHQACRFGDPFDGQPAVHEPAQSKKPPATATGLAAAKQSTEPVDEPLGEQIAQSTQPLDSPEPDDEKADEKLDWFKPIRLGH